MRFAARRSLMVIAGFFRTRTEVLPAIIFPFNSFRHYGRPYLRIKLKLVRWTYPSDLNPVGIPPVWRVRVVIDSAAVESEQIALRMLSWANKLSPFLWCTMRTPHQPLVNPSSWPPIDEKATDTTVPVRDSTVDDRIRDKPTNAISTQPERNSAAEVLAGQAGIPVHPPTRWTMTTIDQRHDVCVVNPAQSKRPASSRTPSGKRLDPVPAPRRASASLRLRLKPARRALGHVQGAWWPRSTVLTDELPTLLSALSRRYGRIASFGYHGPEWSGTTEHIEHQGGLVPTMATLENPHVVSLTVSEGGRLDLLVVPPYTNAEDAYQMITTAAAVANIATPTELLTEYVRKPGKCRDAQLAIQRWECEGGAQPADDVDTHRPR